MPPPPLSTTTNVASTPRSAAPSRPLLSCRKQRSPSSATVGAVRRRRAMPSTVDTKPSMPLTPRLAWNVTPSRARGEALDVADRHARRDHERGAVRAARRRRRARPDLRTARPSCRSGRRSRRAPARRRRSSAPPTRRSTITSTASASAPSSSSGSATIRPLTACCGSSHASSGSTSTWSTSGSSHCTATLLVVRRADAQHDVGPVRVGEPGVAQQRVVGGDGAGHPQVRQRVGEHRPPRRLGERAARSPGATPAPQPATTRPRGRSATRSRERVEHLHRRGPHTRRVGRPRTIVGTTGRVDQLVARRHERLAERQVQVHRARPGGPSGLGHRARRQGPPLGADTGPVAGHVGLVEPAHRVAVELQPGRRSARRRCRAARAGGRRCTRSSAPARDGPRAPRGGSWRRRCPRCRAGARAGRVARARPRAKNDAERSSRCTCRRMRSSPASARASGAEREPGARHGVGDPVAHPLVDERAGEGGGGVAGHGRMPPWTADVRLRHGFTQTHGVVGPVRAALDARSTRAPVGVPERRRLRGRAARASARRSAARATYVGYSQGGRLCLQLALDRPDVGANGSCW